MSRSRYLALALLAVASACARHSGDVGALTPSGTPKFETRTEISSGTGAHADYCVADFDGDTFLDMAVVGLSGELRILLGNGTTFTLGQSLQIDGLPIWIVGGDLDEDGDIDLVVVRNTANSTDVYWNDGNGTFTAGPSLPVGQEALAVVVGDADGDGHLDVLVSRPVAPEILTFFGNGAGSFSSPSSITLPGGGSAFNLQVGDVTRDQLPDLIVADPANNRLLVYPGSANNPQLIGATALELSVPGGPRAVSIGDLDGDGFNDMAVSAFDANKFVIVTEIDPQQGPTVAGFGAGTAQLVPYLSFDIPVSAAPSISTIADVTGDGRPDLVACLLGTASMLVVPQYGNGTFGDHLQYDATGMPLRPFVGDFDHNGKNDLFALSGLGDRINLWLARSNGDLSGARNFDTGLPTAAWLAGGDLDGDGAPDVAVGSYNSSFVKILRRHTDGSLGIDFSIDVGFPVFQIESADLDLDGRRDLLVSVPGGLKVLRNHSSGGSFDFELVPGNLTTIGTSSGPFGVTVADLDRDGSLDVVVCDYSGSSLHIVPGTSTAFVFGQEIVLPLPGGPAAVVAGDFTGDSRLDLAVSRVSMADIVVLRNDGNMQFTQALDVPVGQAPNYLITNDFNRDGRADLVVSNGISGTISVLFGGASGFTGQTYPAGAAPTALLADDLTGDGLPDILVASLQSGDFRVLVGDGKGSFPELVRFPGTLGASDALLQDMDGDGKKDLLIASLVSNRVSLVRNIRQ